mgnify:CR=1 FL=1
MPGPRRTDFKKPKNAKKTFGRILQYAGKSKFMLLAVFVMLIASTVCSVGASYWLKPILNDIDASIRAGNFATVGVQSLMRNLAIVSALYIGASLCTYIQSKVMVKIAYKTTNLIRKELFDHMQTLPLRFFDTQTHGEIMSRYTNDVDNIQMMLEQSMVQLVSSAFTFVGIVVMMIALSPPLFCISLVFMIIMLVTVSKIGKKSKHYFQAQQANLGQMNGNIEESVEGMRVIKVFNHEDQAIAGFDQYNEAFRSAATNANFYAGLMGPVSNGINNAGYALIALFGGLLALTGRLDIGTFFTFLSYAKQFTQPINQIANQMNTIFSALAGAERVFEMMDTASEEDQGTVTLTVTGAGEEKRWYWQDGDRRVPVHGAVEFHHVTFAYVPEKVVLHDISLYAKEGQKIAFVGSTGAGKTVTLQCLGGRLRQQGKRVIIIAPKKGHEFRPLCEKLGGLYLRMSPSSKDCPNLMAIRRKSLDSYAKLKNIAARDDSVLADKISQLIIWFSLKKKDLSEEDKSRLDSSLVEVYGRYGITFDNRSIVDENGDFRTMPIISDWYEVLSENPDTQYLAVVLSRYVTGSASAMAGRNDIDLDNKYIVLDLSGMPDDMIADGTFWATSIAYDLIMNCESDLSALLADELWSLVGATANPQAAGFILEMVKTIRGLGGIAVTSTQGMQDLFGLEGGSYGKGILDASRIKLVMQMEEQEARLIQDKLNLSEDEVRQITRFRRGEGLLCIGYNHVPVAFHTTAKEYEAITTSPTDLRRGRMEQNDE